MKIQIEKIKLAEMNGRKFFEFKVQFQSDSGKDYIGRGCTEAACLRQLAFAVAVDELRGK